MMNPTGPGVTRYAHPFDTGSRRTLPADTAAAGPRRSAQDLIEALEFSGDELYIVGDVVRPRSVHNAVREGFLVGVRI